MHKYKTVRAEPKAVFCCFSNGWRVHATFGRDAHPSKGKLVFIPWIFPSCKPRFRINQESAFVLQVQEISLQGFACKAADTSRTLCASDPD